MIPHSYVPTSPAEILRCRNVLTRRDPKGALESIREAPLPYWREIGLGSTIQTDANALGVSIRGTLQGMNSPLDIPQAERLVCNQLG